MLAGPDFQGPSLPPFQMAAKSTSTSTAIKPWSTLMVALRLAHQLEQLVFQDRAAQYLGRLYREPMFSRLPTLPARRYSQPMPPNAENSRWTATGLSPVSLAPVLTIQVLTCSLRSVRQRLNSF